LRILLTGGAGDLGQVLSGELARRGDTPVCLDVRAPLNLHQEFIAGSILDRPLLRRSLENVDCVVHIAAWHGIHWVTQQKDVYDFWDLNVTGTFNVFQMAAEAGVRRVVYISSESVSDRFGVYGHTKVLGEEIAHTYAHRHGQQVIILRPRAFIPYWNRAVYQSFVDWAKWFWPGAVHIDDVRQAVVQALDLLARQSFSAPLVLDVDGAYDYTVEDLRAWDSAGPGTTFKRYYGEHYYELAMGHGLNPAQKPTTIDMTETHRWLGYEPHYSLKNLLLDLEQFGVQGPPPPEF
jgi:nucleoside-diphosphate-sugar epimerase